MIFIDDSYKPYKEMLSCHLISDIPGAKGELELIEFAKRIGMHIGWLQKPGTFMAHFDCMRGMIDKALRAGATQVSARKLCKIIDKKRGRK